MRGGSKALRRLTFRQRTFRHREAPVKASWQTPKMDLTTGWNGSWDVGGDGSCGGSGHLYISTQFWEKSDINVMDFCFADLLPASNSLRTVSWAIPLELGKAAAAETHWSIQDAPRFG